MSDTLSLLESLDLENVPDLAPVAPGEYELRILSAAVVDGKQPGAKNILIVAAIEGEPNALNVFHYISMPNENDSKDMVDSKRRRIKDDFRAFDLVPADIGEESSKGKTAWVILGSETYEGTERNVIKRIINPR